MTLSPWRPARRAERMNPSVIREILKVTERPGILSMAGGLPSPLSFPVEAMRSPRSRRIAGRPADGHAARARSPPASPDPTERRDL